MEERGWDTTPTAGGVYELLRDLSELVPGIFELEIEELIAGLRPATPDNLPAIGPGALEGLVWATGHYRNGILLTPVTADLVAGALAGEPLPDWAAPADPLRFAGVRRMNVVLNGEPHEFARRRDRRGRARGARPARRGPRRRRRRRRRGRPARRSGARPSCTKGRGWRSCARSREAEMAVTDTSPTY